MLQTRGELRHDGRVKECDPTLTTKSRLAGLLASLLLAAAGTAADAQPAAVQAAPKFEDTIARRTLACTACHGQQGRAGPDGYYPRLAGKPAGYLYNQLLNFRDGRRHYGLMASLVDPLSDTYLMEIAQYFAALEVPYPAPQPVRGRDASTTAQLARGETLALKGDASRQLPACVQCHGAALTGVQPGTPGLLGLPRDYLNGQLGAWKTAQRRAHAPDCMATIANRMSLDDVASVTLWLAAQPLPAVTKPAASLAAALPMECGSAPALRAGKELSPRAGNTGGKP